MGRPGIEVYVYRASYNYVVSNVGSMIMASKANDTPLRGEMRFREPMAKHTSWKVGGPAERFYIPADLTDLSNFLAQCPSETKLIWLGLGSNLLVRDGGFNGTVIAIAGVLEELSRCGENGVMAGAGVSCNKFARYAVTAGYSGVEFLAGIPGTIGGALAMNAGAFGGETWDYVRNATTISRDGTLQTRLRAAFEPGYRFVKLPQQEWFIAAEFQLPTDPEHAAPVRLKELLARRAASQPTGQFSCGSVFRNPPGDHAGRLIDVCGLKGARIGKARVSDKHANFIINDDHASAMDIEQLIQFVQQRVHEQTGVYLEAEVRIIGIAGSTNEVRV